MKNIKSKIKNIIPNKLIKTLRYFIHPHLLYYFILIHLLPLRYKLKILKLKNKEIINVAFFVTHSNSWKYEGIYQLMQKAPQFNPIIVICPVINMGVENLLYEINKCKQRFNSYQYNVVSAFNTETNKYLDVKKEINPDIIFHCNPYRGLIDERYYILNHLYSLNCYVSYAFNNTNKYSLNYNQLLHNLVWKNFVETSRHKEYAKQHSTCKGKNTVITGYPGVDFLIDKNYKSSDCWKIKDKTIKRIIWAPHHTIEPDGIIHYSCFLKYYEFMLYLADKYKNKIQIAFKPHPLLKVKLYKLWGKEKTDEYYNTWDKKANCMLSDNEYTDLFLNSDAMIHDSGSFLIEYLFTNKPVMRTCFLNNWKNELNDFAKDCLSVYYLGFNNSDIENFIIDQINSKDTLYNKRTSFIKNNLNINEEVTPSEKIIKYIKKELNI